MAAIREYRMEAPSSSVCVRSTIDQQLEKLTSPIGVGLVIHDHSLGPGPNPDVRGRKPFIVKHLPVATLVHDTIIRFIA